MCLVDKDIYRQFFLYNFVFKKLIPLILVCKKTYIWLIKWKSGVLDGNIYICMRGTDSSLLLANRDKNKVRPWFTSFSILWSRNEGTARLTVSTFAKKIK